MKKLLIGLMLFLSMPAWAEFYKVNITRIEKDLYKTTEGVFIETKYCYEYATREDAVLSYERYSYDNKLIFSNNQSCDVKRVLK